MEGGQYFGELNRRSPTAGERSFTNKTGEIRMQGVKEFENAVFMATVPEYIVTGVLQMIDMTDKDLPEFEGSEQVRFSLRYCRTMLQLLLPDEAFSDE